MAELVVVHSVHSRATPLPRAPIPPRLRLFIHTRGSSQYNFVVHELDLEELREIYKICKLLGPRAVRLAAASIPRSS